jgi:hypothetical protein
MAAIIGGACSAAMTLPDGSRHATAAAGPGRDVRLGCRRDHCVRVLVRLLQTRHAGARRGGQPMGVLLLKTLNRSKGNGVSQCVICKTLDTHVENTTAS